MIRCNDAHDDFSAYWEGELPAARREKLEAHWKACEACRAEYESFAGALRALRALPRLDAPESFASRVLVRVRQIENARAASGWAPGRLFDWRAWRADWGFRPAWAAAAAAVLVVVVGVAVLNRGELPTPRTDSSGQEVALETPPATPSDLSREAAPGPSPSAPETRGQPTEPDLAVAQLPEAAPLAKTAGHAAPEESRIASRSGEIELSQKLATRPLPPATSSSILDSLFRQEMDVEFALDRIRLRRVPGDSGLTPMPAMPGAPEGKPASLTF